LRLNNSEFDEPQLERILNAEKKFPGLENSLLTITAVGRELIRRSGEVTISEMNAMISDLEIPPWDLIRTWKFSGNENLQSVLLNAASEIPESEILNFAEKYCGIIGGEEISRSLASRTLQLLQSKWDLEIFCRVSEISRFLESRDLDEMLHSIATAFLEPGNFKSPSHWKFISKFCPREIIESAVDVISENLHSAKVGEIENLEISGNLKLGLTLAEYYTRNPHLLSLKALNLMRRNFQRNFQYDDITGKLPVADIADALEISSDAVCLLSAVPTDLKSARVSDLKRYLEISSRLIYPGIEADPSVALRVCAERGSLEISCLLAAAKFLIRADKTRFSGEIGALMKILKRSRDSMIAKGVEEISRF
jgi:hypothetical protein